MTHTDYTKLMLNIEDENIYFNEICLEIVNIKGAKTKVFHGYLTYNPDYCPKCGCVNNSFDDIIKWNWKRNCKIKITKACGYNTLLILDKQRFLCKHCNKTFTASTNVVNFHKQISNDTNLNIRLELMEKGSEKEIVTYLINTDKTLYADYQLYQGLDNAINIRDKNLFFKIVNNNLNNKIISKKSKKALKTFKEMKQYIDNSFDYEYSNGIVEGINNVIKQIKHTACGYKKFTHLKARVMLIKGLYNPIIQN